jgi:negative regulator of sigma E activity
MEETMERKTQRVYELVEDVLRTLTKPYGEDVTEDVFLAIESNPSWRRRYDQESDELRAWVVNNHIGLYAKEVTGMATVRKVAAKRSKLITAYTKLAAVRSQLPLRDR